MLEKKVFLLHFRSAEVSRRVIYLRREILEFPVINQFYLSLDLFFQPCLKSGHAGKCRGSILLCGEERPPGLCSKRGDKPWTH